MEVHARKTGWFLRDPKPKPNDKRRGKEPGTGREGSGVEHNFGRSLGSGEGAEAAAENELLEPT